MLSRLHFATPYTIVGCLKFCFSLEIRSSIWPLDFEVTKPKRGREKKADTKINEVEENDVRDKRDRLITCVLSGNSKTLFRKGIH